jgi:hypothetical protein
MLQKEVDHLLFLGLHLCMIDQDIKLGKSQHICIHLKRSVARPSVRSLGKLNHQDTVAADLDVKCAFRRAPRTWFHVFILSRTIVKHYLKEIL